MRKLRLGEVKKFGGGLIADKWQGWGTLRAVCLSPEPPLITRTQASVLFLEAHALICFLKVGRSYTEPSKLPHSVSLHSLI